MKLFAIYKRLRAQNEEHLKFQESQGWNKEIRCNLNGKPGGIHTLMLAFEVWKIERKHGEETFKQYRDLVALLNQEADVIMEFRGSDPSWITMNAVCAWKFERSHPELKTKRQILKDSMEMIVFEKGRPIWNLGDPFYHNFVYVRWGLLGRRHRLGIWYLWNISSWYSKQELKAIQKEYYSWD